MFKEFKDFAMRGNVIDLAVGFILGGAFSTIVSSLVSDILMPPLGLLIGGVDFSNLFLVIKNSGTYGHFNTLADAQTAGAITINYGLFINRIISFTIVAFALFILIKGMNNLNRQQVKPALKIETKECPFCFSSIPVKATKCPNCTSLISN